MKTSVTIARVWGETLSEPRITGIKGLHGWRYDAADEQSNVDKQR